VAVTFGTPGHKGRDVQQQLPAQAGSAVSLGRWIANFLRDATCHRLVHHYRQLQGKFERELPAQELEPAFLGYASGPVGDVLVTPVPG